MEDAEIDFLGTTSQRGVSGKGYHLWQNLDECIGLWLAFDRGLVSAIIA